MSGFRAILILALSCLPGLAQDSGLAVRAESAVGRSRINGGKLGILIYSTKREAPLYEKDAKKVLRLASNTKLFTTACALAKLGPDYRFRTTLAWEEGSGDLHVFGAGDPLISGRLHNDDPTRLFRDAAARLKELGRTSFPGQVVVHPGIFDRVHLHPAWVAARYDQDAWWCAPVGGLTYNDNCIDITYAPGERPGDPVKLTLRPDTKYVTIVNRARTVKSNPDPFGFVRRDGTNQIIVNGELQAGAKPQLAWVALHDPGRYFGTVLKETLEREGIPVAGGVTESEAMRLEGKSSEFILAEHTLADAVTSCNTVSQNLHAEMILKLLGFRFRGAGTTAAGLEVVQEFLRTEVGVSDVELTDGSGLSRENRASAESVVKLLAYMRNHRHGKAFAGSLAVAGASGTLKERMESTGGRIHAKTGSISGVSCLSGYAETSQGETLIFSILANDWRSGGGTPRDLQDALGELMASWKAP